MKTVKEKQRKYINQILCAHVLDALRKLPSNIVQCCITSPPYWGLRAYSGEQNRIWGGKDDCKHKWQQCYPAGESSDDTSDPKYSMARTNHSRLKENICLKCGAYWGALGLEAIHDCMAWAKGEPPCAVCYVCHIRTVFAQVRRVLRDDGTLFLNMGDCYATSASGRCATETKAIGKDDRTFRDKPFSTVGTGLKPKDLVGIPWRSALALQADGYTLRSDIIYAKNNPMPESVVDRPTKGHEYLFLLTKSAGKPTYWTHRDGLGARTKPKPDYRWIHKETGQKVAVEPANKDNWRRINLWKGHDYYYDADAIREPHQSKIPTYDFFNKPQCVKKEGKLEKGRLRWRGMNLGALGLPRMGHPLGRNKRSVWTISTEPVKEAHFATFPKKVVRPCILAGTSPKACAHCGAPYERMHNSINALGWSPTCDCKPPDDSGKCLVLDPFIGSGTVAIEALNNGRAYIGIDISKEYVAMAKKRIKQETQQAALFKKG